MPVTVILNSNQLKMTAKKWLVIATVVVFAASCGESSTEGTSTTDTIATVNQMSETTPPSSTTTIVVPDPVKVSFEKKYPNVSNVTWTRYYEPINTFDWELAEWPAMDTSDFMVTYKSDNNDYWTWYDDENNWIGTVSAVTDFAGLPAAVNKTIESEFPGYTILSVDKENDKNRTAYEIELSKGEDKMKALIEENGTVLKKKGKVDGVKTKEKNI